MRASNPFAVWPAIVRSLVTLENEHRLFPAGTRFRVCGAAGKLYLLRELESGEVVRRVRRRDVALEDLG